MVRVGRSGRLGELEFIEAPIEAVLTQERLVSSPLRYPPPVQNKDLIRTLDSGETVGNDEDRATLQEAVDGFLDQPFGFGVQSAGGLVENQDGRVP
jgi:hypothetical protein